jgi:outer membrane biosynthesis protein TonB
MRTSLLEQVRSGVLTEGKKAAAENFIINEATYEQLLNLAFNPARETEYKATELLEKVALESYASVLEADETAAEKKADEKKEEKKEEAEEKKEEKKEEAKEKKEEKKDEVKKESVFESIEVAVLENEILEEAKKVAKAGKKGFTAKAKAAAARLWKKAKDKMPKSEFIKKHKRAAIILGFVGGTAAIGAAAAALAKKRKDK